MMTNGNKFSLWSSLPHWWSIMLGLSTYSFILLALAVSVWRRPAIAVAAVLCLYGLKQWGQSSTAFLAEYRQLTNYAVAAIALLAVTLASVRRSCLFYQMSVTAILIGALYLYALVTVAWAADWHASLQQWGVQGPYLLTVVLLAPLLLTDLEDVRTAFLWTAMTGAAICILALIFGHWGFRGLLLYGDIDETETNPLALASMAGTVLLIAALSLGRPHRLPMRLFALVCIPIALAVVLRSGSRGQLLATAAGLVIAWPIAFRPKNGRAIGALMVAAVVLLGLGWLALRLVDIDASRWSSAQSQEDIAGRFELARTLLAAAAMNPLTLLFGLGNSSSFQILGIYPHITGLEVLAEEGLVGAVLYGMILVHTLMNIWRLANILKARDATRTTLAMLAGLFVFELVLSWKQGTLLSSVYVFAYAIVIDRLAAALGRDAARMTSGASALTSISTGAAPFPNLMR